MPQLKVLLGSTIMNKCQVVSQPKYLREVSKSKGLPGSIIIIGTAWNATNKSVTIKIRAATWENRIFACAKTKTQISFAVTAKLISVFVFATRIVQSLYFLNPKFQVPSHLLWLYSPVCVGPGRKPRGPVFWRRGSITSKYYHIKAAARKCQNLIDSQAPRL